MKTRRAFVVVLGLVASGSAPALAQQTTAAPVLRAELLTQPLPPGNFRTVQAVTIELAPAAAAPRHRHDVAVVAYVLEGAVENQFDGGTVRVYSTGEMWWEAPGTTHDVARNASQSERARLLIVYIGEAGKAATVRLN